jgi:hypothetical protein
VRQIVSEALERRPVDCESNHAMLQLDRLENALPSLDFGALAADKSVRRVQARAAPIQASELQRPKGGQPMIDHSIATREDWLSARMALLAEEKEFTRTRDALNAKRRALPWVRIDKPIGSRATMGR